MTPPIPERKPSLDNSLLNKGADLFGGLFGGGMPGMPGGFSGSSSATSKSGPIYANTTFGSDFTVVGQGGKAGQGFDPMSIIVLALVAGAVYIAGRK